jgi:hypothetical protein
MQENPHPHVDIARQALRTTDLAINLAFYHVRLDVRLLGRRAISSAGSAVRHLLSGFCHARHAGPSGTKTGLITGAYLALVHRSEVRAGRPSKHGGALGGY